MVAAPRRQGGPRLGIGREVVICRNGIVVRRGSKDKRDRQSRSGWAKGKNGERVRWGGEEEAGR